MKIFLFSICIVLLGCSIYFFNYFKEYPVKESSSESELTNVIEQIYNNNSSPIVIRKKLDIENNYKAVVFTTKKEVVGIAVFKKGWFNRFKFMYLSTMGNTAYSHISKTNIFIVYGKKPSGNSNQLKVTALLDGSSEVLNFKLDDNPYYLQYKFLKEKEATAIVSSDSYQFKE